MQAELQPSVYGCTADLPTVCMSRGRCPSARFICKGTSQFMIVRGTDLVSYMTMKGHTMVSPDTMQTFWKALNKDLLEDMLKSFKVFKCTCGPGNVLILPFDYIFLEYPSVDTDV